MGENTQEKNLVEKKESFFHKIRKFFKGLFKKKEEKMINDENNSIKEDNNFKENMKIVEEESEEMKILELQKRYRRGEIAESDLTEKQIDALGELYDRQIADLKKIIEEKEKQIAESKERKTEKKNA